jgi:hypothetical protein
MCGTCDGHGEVASDRAAHASDPFPTEQCPDCDGPHGPKCEVCGYNLQVAGFDCLVCDTVSHLHRHELTELDPDAFVNAMRHALSAALGDG